MDKQNVHKKNVIRKIDNRNTYSPLQVFDDGLYYI